MMIHGITEDKARLIVTKYPTPHILHEYFRNEELLHGREHSQNLLQNIFSGKKYKKLSERIYQIFMSNDGEEAGV